MKEHLQRRVLLRRGLALLPFVACAAPAGAAPAAQTAPDAPKGGPFSDVPQGYPAYAAMHYLSVIGLFTGYPEDCYGRSVRTRYEFAVALQRVTSDLGRRLTPPEQLPRVPAGPMGPPDRTTDDRKLREILADPEQFRRLLGWVRALVSEFSSELAMLGTDPAQIEKKYPEWQRRVEEQAAPKK